MLETSARLLELLALLQMRREWTGRELAARLEVGTRTVRRDIERLRRLGYPVEATRGVAGGYRLAAGASLPPLLLDDEEATAIAVGLRTAAGASVAGIEEAALRALVKLEQVLPKRLRRHVEALGSTTVSFAPTGPTIDPETLTLIAGACRERESLRFDYSRRDGSSSRRLVEPVGIANLGRRWYLVAWDCEREDWRTFRVDRVRDARPGGRRFEPRDLPAADVADFVAKGLSSTPHRYSARVTLLAPLEEVRERAPARWGSLEALDEHSCEYRTGDDELEWFALRILMLGVDFEVREPPELVRHIDEIAARPGRATARA